MVLRKSKLFSRETRRNNSQRHAEEKEARRREVEPKTVIVETARPQDEIEWEARQALRDQGIEPPRPVSEICYKEPTRDELMGACAQGLASELDASSILSFKGILKAGGLGMKACGQGALQMLVDRVRDEEECRERREPDYKKEFERYETMYQYELSKVEKTKKTEVKVEVTDPRHPNYKPPAGQGPIWNSRDDRDRDWNFTFNTNGKTSGAGIQWRF